MIYGKGSKGNYPMLSNTKKLPVFPHILIKKYAVYMKIYVSLLGY